MHQFPRSAVRTGTDRIPRYRARNVRPRPNEAHPTRTDQANEPLARPGRDLRVRPHRPLPPRAEVNRAANLRRIDGAQLGHPHDRPGAAAEPRRNRPDGGVGPRPPLASVGAGDPPWQEMGMSIPWRHRRTRPAPCPRLWPAAASVHFGVSLPAGSEWTASRVCADVPAPSRCHPAACFANSPALPH